MAIDTFPLPWDSTVDNHPDIPDAQGRNFQAYLTGCILCISWGKSVGPAVSISVYVPALAAAPFGLPANSQFFRLCSTEHKRKNWLFSDSVEGANASAVVYTMVEMAKVHGLNIYGYLKFLLEHRPTKEMTDEQLAELAPWSEKLQSTKNRM